MSQVDLTVLNTADWTLDHCPLMQLQGIGEGYAGACPVSSSSIRRGRCSTTRV